MQPAIPEAYLGLVFSPTPCNVRRQVQREFPTTISSVSRGVRRRTLRFGIGSSTPDDGMPPPGIEPPTPPLGRMLPPTVAYWSQCFLMAWPVGDADEDSRPFPRPVRTRSPHPAQVLDPSLTIPAMDSPGNTLPLQHPATGAG